MRAAAARKPLSLLANHLQKGLRPLYVLHGDEALPVQEAADANRAEARESACGRHPPGWTHPLAGKTPATGALAWPAPRPLDFHSSSLWERAGVRAAAARKPLSLLANHLQKGLRPLCVLHDDEALLLQEAADAIRAAARKSACGRHRPRGTRPLAGETPATGALAWPAPRPLGFHSLSIWERAGVRAAAARKPLSLLAAQAG